MDFAHPIILAILLPGVIPLIWWHIVKFKNSHAKMSVSSLKPLDGYKKPIRARLLRLPFILELLAYITLVFILARPQTHDHWHNSNVEGTDIVLSVDISSSMLARDFTPNRIEAAKEVATKFVNGREYDNIGLVIFAAESLTGVPMTTDRSVLTNYIASISSDMLPDGTAIGDGIGTAINRLSESNAKSKSIVLLTDGSNNTGVIDPLIAAEIAKAKNIKIYTIGIGTNGMADFPQIDYFGRLTYVPMPVKIDEQTLRRIADTTGGQYFRATNNRVLEDIFAEIDRLETSVIDVKNYTHTEDNYMLLAWIAFGLIGLDILLRSTLLRTIP